MNDDYFAEHGYTPEEREAYEAERAVARDFVQQHMDDPLIERLRLSQLLLADAVRQIAAAASHQEKRIAFLEQMLLKEES